MNLTKLLGYQVTTPDSEKTSSIKGYYADKHIATLKATGTGWYGSDGKVDEVELWKDEEGMLYKLEKIERFTDEQENYKKNLLDSIKAKLSPEELELLGVK